MVLDSFKFLDLSIFFLAGLFLIGLVITEYKTLGFEEPLITISHEWKLFFEYLLWPLIGILVLYLG